MGNRWMFAKTVRRRGGPSLAAVPAELFEPRQLLSTVSPESQTAPVADYATILVYTDSRRSWLGGMTHLGVYGAVRVNGTETFVSYSTAASSASGQSDSSAAAAARLRIEDLSSYHPGTADLRFADADWESYAAQFWIAVGATYQVSAQWAPGMAWSAPQPVVFNPTGMAQIRVQDAASFATSGFAVIPPAATIIDDPFAVRPD